MSTEPLSLISLANELEALIHHSVPDCTSHSKYGGTLFTVKPDEKEGQFCGVFIYTEHVQVSFSQGANLKDPSKLLSGTGKKRRHVNFKSAGDIDFSYLESLLQQSARLD
ncbi:DUF1801 domain-containing protein [Leucothrix arctica]|uniref:DUF1801 domain-containing protein n=1 Tax=Leucothrix arctica TaxID=1481894 RepID=A0A317C545_9GAMM|nr:DUF1801 domain-containing protein [Leucothrix arctica]PWQ93417.1 DUF1801 domain-containing protein [Leucothrix arctica]